MAYVTINGVHRTVHKGKNDKYYYTKDGKRVYTRATVKYGTKPKSVRKSRKSTRKSRKSTRKSRKSTRKSRKSTRRSRKSTRRSRKSTRRSTRIISKCTTNWATATQQRQNWRKANCASCKRTY